MGVVAGLCAGILPTILVSFVGLKLFFQPTPTRRTGYKRRLRHDLGSSQNTDKRMSKASRWPDRIGPAVIPKMQPTLTTALFTEDGYLSSSLLPATDMGNPIDIPRPPNTTPTNGGAIVPTRTKNGL